MIITIIRETTHQIFVPSVDEDACIKTALAGGGTKLGPGRTRVAHISARRTRTEVTLSRPVKSTTMADVAAAKAAKKRPKKTP